MYAFHNPECVHIYSLISEWYRYITWLVWGFFNLQEHQKVTNLKTDWNCYYTDVLSPSSVYGEGLVSPLEGGSVHSSLSAKRGT